MGKLMYSWRRLLVLLLLLALNNESNSASTELPQEEVDALDAIDPFRTKNDGYKNNSCPESPANSSSYNKIWCDCVNYTVCHVTRIDFSEQSLEGVITPTMANLTFLNYLDLSNNKLHGSIPDALGNLSRLSYIDLSGNKLRGPLPDEFKKLSRLSYMDLSENHLKGYIPTFLGTMKSLKWIDLSKNFLDGPIPPDLGALPSLQHLSLWQNLLSGHVPEDLGNISTLQYLDLSDNQLNGSLPGRLENLRNLEELFLNTNEFTGGFPSSFAEFNNLTMLDIMGNNFTGPIPEFIGKWKQLWYLSLMGNSFEGPIPTSISSLTNLYTLHVADLIGGSNSFPDIERMTFMQYLTLRNCSITGPIPGYIGQMKYLIYLDLSFNSLTGELPVFFHPLQFRSIYLKGNMLSGSLPRWLTSTKSNVDLSENKFTNVSFIRPRKKFQNVNLFACCSTPIENQNYTRQKADFQCDDEKPKNDHLYINCGGEKTPLINGSIYESDSLRDGASTFYLSPDKNWAYSSMGDFLFTGSLIGRYIKNQTCGLSMVDATLYKTARISPTSLKYYGLCLKNGNYTVRLHFAEIVFIEEKDFSSKGERVFDVKIQNKTVLSNFNIKKAARGVNLPIYMDFEVVVGNHLLEIHFYWAGKGSVYVPPGLYGPLISAISAFPVIKSSGGKDSRLSRTIITGIAGSALLFLVLVLVFIWKMGWLRGKELQSEELKSLELYPGGLFNFRQIKAATQKFSSANKIGEGGFGPVYKGVLPNGAAIAVKQLSSKSKQGISEFVNEIGTISALHHPNLVKLLGCCAEDNQLLIVYEYMENNSLAHALFGPEESKSKLNWSTRVKICLGIARGLAFLHEESKLKIIHRDVKPTNVLLDKDLNAKISDFGFAKLYEEEKTHVITRIAGTTGYMAPEYAMRGHLTYKADVYSFGVVVLEIVSGKNSVNYRPNEETVYLLDLAFVLQEKGDLLVLVDPTLGNDYSAKEALTILELAMLCTNQSPTLRPKMSEVVKILEGKTQMKSPSIRAPYSPNDFAKSEAMVELSTQFGSTSTEGISNSASSLVICKEGEECNISVD